MNNLINEEFQLQAEILYLNHAAVSPWPRRTAKVIREFADQNRDYGSYHYLEWMKNEQSLKQQLARLINASSADEIALLKNTSEALSIVAYGIEWQSGDNVVISDQEFPSNRIVWQSLQQYGVDVRRVDLSNDSSPELALIKHFDSRTRILSISSVQYASGLKLNLAELGAACSVKKVLFCVDAIQSVGAVSIDVEASQIDFLMADGHKWMCAPEGLALFYCRSKYLETLKLHQYGWRMVEDYLDFNRLQWEPAKSARRFECGSPNMLGIHALQASISLIDEIGMTQIESKLLENVRFLFDLLESIPDLEILTSQETNRYAGIVTFKSHSKNNEQLYKHLMRHKVMCAYRAGGIRFSPHFYTSQSTLTEALNILEYF